MTRVVDDDRHERICRDPQAGHVCAENRGILVRSRTCRLGRLGPFVLLIRVHDLHRLKSAAPVINVRHDPLSKIERGRFMLGAFPFFDREARWVDDGRINGRDDFSR
eukprot:5871915-Pleurochrysis_carterae.AAC.1